MNSWYKQDRDLFERAWAKDPKCVSVYVYLHCHAYVRDGRLHGQIIRKGSCPTSKPAIEEATGLTRDEVKLRLRTLRDSGEIIVKPTNKGMIVTLCDYDGYNDSEDLFGLNMPTEDSTRNTTQASTQTTTWNTPYIDNKIIDNKNIRSNYIPSNKERESNKSLVYEIKAMYNKTFEGILPEWQRLSDKMVNKVGTCIMRYGRQSVDLVFDQIQHEPFSLGENNTGFRADFDYIFKLENFEKYLARYKLRISGKQHQEPAKPAEQPNPSKGSWLDAYNDDSNWRPK